MPLACIAAGFVVWSVGICSLSAATDAPLSLPDAIQRALANNQDIKVESFGPAISRANVLTAFGQFDPVLVFNRSYARTDAPASANPIVPNQVRTDNYGLTLQGVLPWGLNYNVGGNAINQRGLSSGFSDQYSTFGGINLTQPLLRGFGLGTNLAGVRVAKTNRSISEWQYRQTVIDTVTNTIVLYSELLLANDQLRIATNSRDLAATLLAQNENRLKIGSVGQSDVITARAEMAAREEGIILARRAVRRIQNELRELIGEKSFAPGQPELSVILFESPEIAVNPAQDFQTALTQRPDYQAARQGVTIDKALETAARNGRLPQVDLVASYGYNGLDRDFARSRRMVNSKDYPSSSIGFNVALPITNAQERGKARAAQLKVRQSETALNRLETDIAVIVANAADDIETARQRVAAGKVAYAASKQTLDNEEEKLQAGTSTTLAVIQLQQSLINVENSMATANAAQREASAEYDRACGATLQRYHIELASQTGRP